MGFLDRLRGQSAAPEIAESEWFVLCSSASSMQSIVGEASYQPCLDKTIRGASATPPFGLTEWPFQSETGRPWFAAYLQRDPNNSYDANAVVVQSKHGVIGYLERNNAKRFQPVLQLLESHGLRGGACAAYALRGDNGMWGVVLVLRSGGTCLEYAKAAKSFRA